VCIKVSQGLRNHGVGLHLLLQGGGIGAGAGGAWRRRRREATLTPWPESGGTPGNGVRLRQWPGLCLRRR
jgi:hypothetical protein